MSSGLILKQSPFKIFLSLRYKQFVPRQTLCGGSTVFVPFFNNYLLFPLSDKIIHTITVSLDQWFTSQWTSTNASESLQEFADWKAQTNGRCKGNM